MKGGPCSWLALSVSTCAGCISLPGISQSFIHLSLHTSTYQPTDQIGAMWVSHALAQVYTHTHTPPNLSGSSAPSDQLNLCICLRRMPLMTHRARIQKMAFENQLDLWPWTKAPFILIFFSPKICKCSLDKGLLLCVTLSPALAYILNLVLKHVGDKCASE